jgi:hypothetical protein
MAMPMFSLALVAFGIWLLTRRELQVTHTRRLLGPVATGLSLLYIVGGLALTVLAMAMTVLGQPILTDNAASARFFWLLSEWLWVLGACAVATVGVIIWTCVRPQSEA